MNATRKAIWYIESHFAEEITLDAIASAAGVSRYHLSRTFGLAVDRSVMEYVRCRRLTLAAKALANGAPDILDVAIEAGYGSHEAFTRAFRDQFGLTPEAVRVQGHLQDLKLTEPLRMNEAKLIALDAPRIETGKPLLIAGMSERYTAETCVGIPAQWQRFAPHIGTIPGQAGNTAYGVLCNGDDSGNTDYICGVEVSDFARVPEGWARLRIPEQKYAVFTHREHVSGIQRTWYTVFNKWFPESEYISTGGPEFERYTDTFNPATGLGGLEIWIPIREG